MPLQRLSEVPDQLGDGYFFGYSRKSATLDFFNAKTQFGDCQNSQNFISESGTSENLCTCITKAIHRGGAVEDVGLLF